MTYPVVALIVTALLLAGLLLLGLSLQLGWRRNQARWSHHALYFAVILGLIITIFLFWRTDRDAWPFVPTLLLLLSMPFTRPGKANHWQRALLVALTFMAGAVVTVR